ncbi:DUF3052 family protein [Balneolaceae bacterium YR4-1]|uniref:DUF3052 family protein n=1 Tax=Halalkalibaculum roseum TaxID=2709311 RepID=A0A6M1TC17_9BACT|nr:DUF3052 family protein [Halalkalibaculum roseum]NGP77673.1 DUF3052 family protein [Halalkalibaculum roseum]
MPAGYSGTPLIKKLGIKPGFKIMTENEPDHYFEMLGELPPDVTILDDGEEEADFIHLFAKNEETLQNALPPLKDKLARDGMLWVSWIKGASKRNTDINGNDVRRKGLELGLVDIKVCAVDKNWSGLKFMYRKEDR